MFRCFAAESGLDRCIEVGGSTTGARIARSMDSLVFSLSDRILDGSTYQVKGQRADL